MLSAILSLVTYMIGFIVVVIAIATYIWFKKPALAVKSLFRLNLYMSGLRPQYVKVGKYLYCYAERGYRRPDRTSMLLIHGFSASKDQWVPIVQKLPRDLHIVVLDLPGHGDTTIPDPNDPIKLENLVVYVNQFVNAIRLNEKPFHMVGTSMGGAITGSYAADYPQDLDRVTVICPALRTPIQTEFLKEIDRGHCRLIPQTTDELKAMLNSCVYHPINIADQFYVGALQLRLPKTAFYNQLFLALSKDTEGEEKALRKLTDIKTPAQVIWGKDDQIIHVSGVEMLKEKVPHIERVEVYERCGHSVALDRPGQLTKSLLEFRGEYKKKED